MSRHRTPLNDRRDATRAVVAAVLCACLFESRPAAADLAACISASEQALTLRRAGKLQEARKQLLACTASACPEEVRSDCGKRMDAVNAAMPSLVIGAKDGSGNDLRVAEVTVDDVRVATMLDGRPLEVNPGEHVLEVTASGQPPAQRKLVIGEGEKARHETFVLGPVAPVILPAAAATEPPSAGLGTRRALAIASAATGVVGLGLGTTFGLLASSQWSNAKTAEGQQATCPTAAVCPAHATASNDHDTAETFATVSTVAFGVGAALVVTGIVTWFTAPARPASPTAAWPMLVPGATATSGTLTVVGAF